MFAEALLLQSAPKSFEEESRSEANPRGLAVVGLIVTPGLMIPCVWDAEKQPTFWKLPGGKGDKNAKGVTIETPEFATVREIFEEVGILLDAAELQLIRKEPKPDHDRFFFRIDLDTTPTLCKQGVEQELTRYISIDEILTMPDFFPPHRRVIERELTACRQGSLTR